MAQAENSFHKYDFRVSNSLHVSWFTSASGSFSSSQEVSTTWSELPQELSQCHHLPLTIFLPPVFLPGLPWGVGIFPQIVDALSDCTDLPDKAPGLHPDPWPPSGTICPLTFTLKPGLHLDLWSPSDTLCLLTFTPRPSSHCPLLCVPLSWPAGKCPSSSVFSSLWEVALQSCSAPRIWPF